ncbi:MAG: hypothetical protein WBB85_19220, partial [Albidovulum sp.]|uniref:hypothetical protein n=1 Tax=Albidovulum sp. TaxID=1872424 RepID=UPI003C986EAD
VEPFHGASSHRDISFVVPPTKCSGPAQSVAIEELRPMKETVVERGNVAGVICAFMQIFARIIGKMARAGRNLPIAKGARTDAVPQQE